MSTISTRATDTEFEQALTPPGWVYSDAALFQREQETLFRKQWLCAGHKSRLQKPGDYFVVNFGSDSIIVSMGAQGQLHGFHNVCRHRGTRLADSGSGTARQFLCPYHAWSYSPDGALLAAPGMDERPDFCPSEYSLLPVSVQTWNGFLFINLDAGAADVTKTWPEMPDLANYDMPALQRVAHHEYTIDTNWKLVCENYNECYHCALAHPQLHRLSAERGMEGFDHSGANFTGGPMGLRDDVSSMSSDGKAQARLLPGVSADNKDLIFYFNLYPNLFLSIAPDYVLTHYLWPLAPGKLHIETEWLCHPSQMDDSFSLKNAVDFWDETNRQDWGLCERAYQGLQSSAHEPGPYHPWEQSVHDFDRWYVQQMFGSGV